MKLKVKFPYIEFFDDYHEINAKQESMNEFIHGVRCEELSPDELGFEYTGYVGGLRYPGLFWIHGQKPSKAQVRKMFESMAEKHGLTRIAVQ